jgi:hypothetical protein
MAALTGAVELLSHQWLKDPKNHLKKVGDDKVLGNNHARL